MQSITWLLRPRFILGISWELVLIRSLRSSKINRENLNNREFGMNFDELVDSLLLEMPRIIKPLKNTESKVAKVWNSVKTKQYKEITEFPLNGYHLIEFENQILLITKDWSKCTYYVNLEQVVDLHQKAIRQVYLWRAQSDVLPAITNIVFWKILLPRYGCIVTDTTQTIMGKDFWLRRLPEAFDMNLKVSKVNQRTKAIAKLDSMKDVYDHESDIWGPSSKHENELIMICK